ncbi:MAG TPA: hypothetical protein VHO46_14090 [Bacteroidales bacterium]|nr:hypothetical protein [Bacteroidales bacterium]
MRILVIDVGGTLIKVSSSEHPEMIKIKSDTSMTPGKMVSKVIGKTGKWQFDAITIGYPGAVIHGHIVVASDLQKDGAMTFEKSWNDLLAAIDSKIKTIRSRELIHGR